MAQKASAARSFRSLFYKDFCLPKGIFLHNGARREIHRNIFSRFFSKDSMCKSKQNILVLTSVHRAFRSLTKTTKYIKRAKTITFQLSPEHFTPKWCCSLSLVSSGLILYHLCAKNLSEICLIKPLLRAKCDASLDFPVFSFAGSQALTNNNVSHHDKKSFLTWMLHDVVPLGLRAAQLVFLFTPMFLTYPLTYLGPQWFEVWLKVLYVAVEFSGATFIKLGQWASTRRDLFSKEVCDLFSNLHFQVQPHAWTHTARILQEAYGELWQKMLHLVEGQSPVGSGCIAQVYRGYISKTLETATLKRDLPMNKEQNKNDNQVSLSNEKISEAETNLIPVAIKVLHPSIQDKFYRDMMLMTSAARFLTWLFPKLHWVNLNQCVQEFKSVMEAQLDMRQECLCLQRFTEDFAAFDQIRVPQPFPHLVRHNILVETFEEGISVGQIVQDNNQPAELKIQLANIGVDIMLQMVFVNNFVHADLHPGNLLVQNMDKFLIKEQVQERDISWCSADEVLEDYHQVSKERDCLRLVLLDCGITSSLQPEDRQKFQEVFTAVVKGEGEAVADLFLSKSVVNHCEDPILFRKEMSQLVRDARQNLASISKIKVAEVMNAVFGVLSRHQIQLEANFATIVLAMAMLEGLGRSLNPDLDLLEKARPVLLGSYFSNKIAGP